MSDKNLLRNFLYDRLLENPSGSWVHKGELERYMMTLGRLGDTTGRRLRELEADGLVASRPVGISKEYRYVGEIVRPEQSGMQCLSISDH